jgi:hypothetical protein
MPMIYLNEMSLRGSVGTIAAGILGLAASMPAAAADVTVTVSATVAQVCLCSSNTATVSIGSIDPSQPGPATGSGTFSYRCTSGVTPSFSGALTTIDLEKGTDKMTATLSYSPATIETGTGLGSGQAKTRTINASIAQTEYENKPAGLYTKNYTITMTP